WGISITSAHPEKASRRRHLRQCPHDRLVEAINHARPDIRDQTDVAGLSRLEAHGRARRNVQAVAKRSPSIEGERRVGLGEMIMTADLDRSVARVGNAKRYRCPILVQDDLAGCWKNLARYHVGHHQSFFARR